MNVTILVLVAATIIALIGMFSLYLPVLDRASRYAPQSLPFQYPRLFAVTTFLLFMVMFPLILFTILFKGMEEQFIDGFYKGIVETD